MKGPSKWISTARVRMLDLGTRFRATWLRIGRIWERTSWVLSGNPSYPTQEPFSQVLRSSSVFRPVTLSSLQDMEPNPWEAKPPRERL